MSDLFDTDSPDYSVDRLRDYADAVKERNREALLSRDRDVEQGPEDIVSELAWAREGD